MTDQIVNVVTKLDTHWSVLGTWIIDVMGFFLAAELNEINKDLQICKMFAKKYGEYWDHAVKELKKQKRDKEALVKLFVLLTY